MPKLIFIRRVSQILFSAVFVYILWSTTYPLRGLVSSQVLFKLDPLIMLMTALSERLLLPGLVFSVAMIALTLILGRFFCGWVCPMGAAIDLAGLFRRRRRKPIAEAKKIALRRPKFFILVFILVLALAGIQAAWVLDPIVTTSRVVSLNLIPAVTLALDRGMQFLIQKFNLYGGFYDFYRSLKEGLLAVNVHFFANSMITFLFFLVVCALSIWISRLWCRMLCPLGAFYALNSRPALLERKVAGCTTCGICVRRCRTGAINKDVSYHKGECILCMDCIYDCPERATRFGVRINTGQGTSDRGQGIQENKNKKEGSAEKGVTRRDFLFLLASAFSMFSLKSVFASSPSATRRVIRPPAALPEHQFVNCCVRCGNCMKVCITNGLQPAMGESGLAGIWTPKLVPEIGYCEYNCTLCGEVCPTGAIPQLPVEQKRKAVLGLAEVEREICFAWGEKKECLVCEEHCPVANKAIKKVEGEAVNGKMVFKPWVDQNLCIGCGICQNKCPVRPRRAIRVQPVG